MGLTKKCVDCGQILPITEFPSNKRGPGGFDIRCMACKTKKRAADKSKAYFAKRDEIAAQKRQFRAENYEAVRKREDECGRKYREAHPEKNRENAKNYYWENRDSIAAKRRKKRETVEYKGKLVMVTQNTKVRKKQKDNDVFEAYMERLQRLDE